MECTADVVVAEMDRCSIIHNAPDMRNISLYESEEVNDRNGNEKDICAAEVRMYGTDKATRVIRFMRCLSVPMNDYLKLWVASPAAESSQKHILL